MTKSKSKARSKFKLRGRGKAYCVTAGRDNRAQAFFILIFIPG